MSERNHDSLDPLGQSLLTAASVSRGHFRYESGHHGDLWLDLDRLFLDSRLVRQWTRRLATAAAGCRPEIACGPLTGGAFIAQFVAAELGAAFVFAERHASPNSPVRYRIPTSLRASVRGKRVLLVDDAVNAGSALLATLADLRDCGADLAGFASLIALGDVQARLGTPHGVPFVALATLERQIWTPEDCPICRSGAPLTSP